MATTIKKVRCINAGEFSTSIRNGEIYEVENEMQSCGKTYYFLKGVLGNKYASRFEDVIEPNFKVGDKVVFARETDDNYICYNKNFDLGKAYEVKSNIETHLLTTNNTNRLLYMPIECFDLAPEPKPEPKFKVGDFVKGIGNRYVLTNSHMTKGVVRHVGDEEEIGVQRLERDGNPISDDIVFDVSEEYFELWEEPKPEVKERATVKKVRCIDAVLSSNKLKTNTIYEVENSYTSNFGTPFYNLKGFGDFNFMQNRFEDVVEEKYPIIEEIFGDTIVFNPPYTIAKLQVQYGPEKGKWFIGKAKCNPSDTYDKWTGFKIAHQRMRESKPCSK